MWKVSWFYEKVHNIANFWGYAAILFIECISSRSYGVVLGIDNTTKVTGN